MHGPLVALYLAEGGGETVDPLGPFFPFIILIVIFWLVILRPQRRAEEEKRKLLEALKKNDQVVTSGGIKGTVVNVKQDEVTLRVDDQNKVKIRFDKSAIVRVLGAEAATPDSDDDAKKS